MSFWQTLRSIFSNQRGEMRTATATRTQVSTRTKIAVTFAAVGMVAAAAFAVITEVRQTSPALQQPSTLTPVTAGAPTGPTGCSLRITKGTSSPSTVRISATAQTIAILRLENTGDRNCEFDGAAAFGELIARDRTAIAARQVTFYEEALTLGRANTGSATVYAGSNYAAPYRVSMSKGTVKLVIPAHGSVIWRASLATAGIPKNLLLDFNVSLNTTPGGNLGGEPVNFKVTAVTGS